MTKVEAVLLLTEHFSEGLVRTIIDAIVEDERERIKEQNEPEIEKTNTYMKQLEDKLKELE